MKQNEKGRRGRRDFTKALATALVAAPAALNAASAQTTPPAPEAKAPPNPQPTPQRQTPPSPVAVAYAGVARARFGERLTPEELARVARDLEGNVRASERLGAHKLANADEPDFEFEA